MAATAFVDVPAAWSGLCLAFVPPETVPAALIRLAAGAGPVAARGDVFWAAAAPIRLDLAPRPAAARVEALWEAATVGRAALGLALRPVRVQAARGVGRTVRRRSGLALVHGWTSGFTMCFRGQGRLEVHDGNEDLPG